MLQNIAAAPIDEVPPFDPPGNGSEEESSDDQQEDESEDESEISGPEEATENEKPVRTGASVELVSIPADEAVQPKPVNISRVLQIIDLDDLPDLIEADRRLLSEIRKEVPENRKEAEVYLKRLKKLASASDPIRLVPLVNRVLDNSTIYYDWLDKEFENQDERIMEYYVGGARGFSFALGNFRSAVLYTVINRLDITSRIVTALQAEGDSK